MFEMSRIPTAARAVRDPCGGDGPTRERRGRSFFPRRAARRLEGLDKVEVDVCFESASSNFLVCSTLPTRRNKQHRITVTYAQIASGEVEVKW